MSENTVAVEETVTDKVYAEIPATLMPFIPVLKGFVTKANEMSAAVRQATSGNAEQVSALIATDPRFEQARAYRAGLAEQLEEIQAKIKEVDNASKAKALELIPEVSGIDVEATKAALLDLRRSKIVPMEKAIIALSSPEVLESIQYHHNIVAVIGVGRNSGAATGAPKFRFDAMVVNGEEVTPKTISKVAGITGLANEDVLSAFKVAADNENLREVAGTSFHVALTGADSKTYEIEFVAKG